MGETREFGALLTSLVDAMPVGVVVLDVDGKVLVYNGHEERIAGRHREDVVGKDFFADVAPCLEVQELGPLFRDNVRGGTLDAKLEVTFVHPHLEKPREVLVRLCSFSAAGAPYAALFVEEVTAAREVERMKEMLMQLLVHDLKNPLAVVLTNIGFVKLAGAQRLDSDIVAALEDAARATHRLQRMVLTLLDVTRLATGDFPLRRERCDLARMLAEIHRDMFRDASRVGVELVLDASPVDALVDAGALRRMVENLVDNAIRHAPPHSRVTMRVDRQGEEARIDVVDQGKGIPEDLRSKVFERYVRLETGAARNQGLGLTFVKMAAEAHGGSAVVVPTEPTGATFRVTLPLAAS